MRLFSEFNEADHCLRVLFGIKFPKAKVYMKNHSLIMKSFDNEFITYLIVGILFI